MDTLRIRKDLTGVPFVGVEQMMKIIGRLGLENMLTGMAAYIEADFARWHEFEKTVRVTSDSGSGVIELMPTSDGNLYGFKYVNCHPGNMKQGLQTVTGFGLLSRVGTGYPILLSEMTILTALRTAATSAVAASYLARPDARSMAIIGNGAQSEFQALAFKALLDVDRLRLFDIDPSSTAKCAANLRGLGLDVTRCESAREAVDGADIVTTVTADRQLATILTDDMVRPGVHLNAVGGDCPGKTELERAILLRSKIFVEHAPQTRNEGEIQQLPQEHPVHELWETIREQNSGRDDDRQVTLFDSVGFAIEDFSALRYLRDALGDPGMSDCYASLDLVARPDDPRDLFGMLRRSGSPSRSQVA